MNKHALAFAMKKTLKKEKWDGTDKHAHLILAETVGKGFSQKFYREEFYKYI